MLVIEGDVAGAGAALDRLDDEAAVCGDSGAAYAASPVGLLRASVAGDWSTAHTAAKTVAARADAAGFDPAGTSLPRMGTLGIITLLAGPTDVAPLAPIEWPMPGMELSVHAWHANCLARAGRIDRAADALGRIDPATVALVERDGYWLATLSMLADAAHLTGVAPIAEAVVECLRPLTDLTIVDPGLVYRGAVAHSAGLAAATCGHHDEAIELLALGLATHQRHGSPWLTARSRQALSTQVG